MEAIYKLKCVIFVLKSTGKEMQTQGNHKENTGNFTLT